MEKSKKSINAEGGFLLCGGWNFSKSVSVGPTFIREMRVLEKWNFKKLSWDSTVSPIDSFIFCPILFRFSPKF